MRTVRELNEELKKSIPLVQITNEKKKEPKIVGCRISKEKVTVKLEDKREISLPISWLASRWFFVKELKAEQLKNYKIWGGGHTLLFPDIDESVPAGIFIEGENYTC